MECVTGFPKSARLLKRKDFTFRPFKRFQTESFKFIYSDQGSGRIGISISKKILKGSPARNRIRRLLRETFRLRRASLLSRDIHIIALPALTARWDKLMFDDVSREWEAFENIIS